MDLSTPDLKKDHSNQPNQSHLNRPQYSNGIVIPLPDASADTQIMLRAALFGLKKYTVPASPTISRSDANRHRRRDRKQGSLLAKHGAGEKSEKLMEAMDALNRRYGCNTVAVASAGTNRTWGMRRECVSPCYTTSWNDVPVAQTR